MLSGYLSGDMGFGQLLAWLIAVTFAITVHEFAHAKSAELAGDSTPRLRGRVTLNPLAHYDPIGTTLFLVFGFGWAKPVPINPWAFRNRRRDVVLVSLWGPLSNLLSAIVLSLPLRLGLAGPYAPPLAVIVFANLVLCIFNLIPIAPLDGAHILEGLLSDKANQRLAAFYARHQLTMLIAVLVIFFVHPISRLVFGAIMVPVIALLKLLAGPDAMLLALGGW